MIVKGIWIEHCCFQQDVSPKLLKTACALLFADHLTPYRLYDVTNCRVYDHHAFIYKSNACWATESATSRLIHLAIHSAIFTQSNASTKVSDIDAVLTVQPLVLTS